MFKFFLGLAIKNIIICAINEFPPFVQSLQSGSSLSSVAMGGGGSSMEEEREGRLRLGEAPCTVMPIIKTRSAAAAAESKLVPTYRLSPSTCFCFPDNYTCVCLSPLSFYFFLTFSWHNKLLLSPQW